MQTMRTIFTAKAIRRGMPSPSHYPSAAVFGTGGLVDSGHGHVYILSQLSHVVVLQMVIHVPLASQMGQYASLVQLGIVVS